MYGCVFPLGTYYQGVPVYSSGRDCAMLGGLCVLRDDCMSGHQTFMKGLCPDKDIGVECCYRGGPHFSCSFLIQIPFFFFFFILAKYHNICILILVTPRASTCEQQQGVCMDDCNSSLRRDIATDCGPDQKCCVLI